MECKKINKIWDYTSYIVCFCLTVILSKNDLRYMAGAILILEGFALYVLNFIRTQNLVDIRGLFSGSWIVGMGLSCLQLSKLQSDWENVTWVCFFCIYLFFMIAFDFTEKIGTKKSKAIIEMTGLEKNAQQ